MSSVLIEMLQDKLLSLQKKHDALVDKTRRMRGYQANYFRYRASEDLKMSKKMEKEVDAMLSNEVKLQQSKQQEIF